MSDLDIRLEGRRWAAEEMSRHHELPGRIEMVAGNLCWNDEERMLLLGALLEHVGAARAVSLGPLAVWKAAIAQRQEDQGWDPTSAVGAEQFWKPAHQRLSFRKRLELKPLAKQFRRR